jgi:protein phosphatase 1 regulatory subunit 7
MPVINKNGYKYYDEISGGGIIVEPDKIDQYINHINENKVRNVVIDYFWGYKIDNIDFIKSCPNIEKLSISSPFIKDYSPITYLKCLNQINIDVSSIKSIGKSSNAILDLSLVPSIEIAWLYSCNNIVNLGKCKNLRILTLTFYNPPSRNLEDLTDLVKLKRLTIVRSNIYSLKGSGNLKQLRRLVLSNLPKLNCIDEIEKLSDNLLVLRIEGCKNIQNYEYAAKIKGLKVLAFTGSIGTFTNGGNIPSISFIKQMPNLKAFIFLGSNVIDGDLSSCIGLEYVAFNNKRHYSLKKEDFPNDKVSPSIQHLIGLPVDDNPDTED